MEILTKNRQISAALPEKKAPGRNYLFNPAIDFLLLGGGSLVILLILRFIFAGQTGETSSAVLALALANVINYPHFSYSYQIFYRDFRRKITDYPKKLRWQYLFAGVVVPLFLILFFVGTVYFETPKILGFAATAMYFSVGWHYVKQGYGMAMVDAVLKRAFYDEREKRAILHNALAVWVFTWLLVNYTDWGSADLTYNGIAYFVFPVPLPILLLGALAAAWTLLRVIVLLFRRRRDGKPTAWNGLLAFFASVYVWLLVLDPIMLMWIPMFHSLQYLAVVWRFESNRERSLAAADDSSARGRWSFHFEIFILTGLALGYLAFVLLPNWLDRNVNYSKELFGASLFIFMFLIFINIHHYFLDSVCWRKENPDVRQHLFEERT